MSTASQLEYSKNYKQFERATNPKFRDKEQEYRNTYNRNKYAKNRVAMAFVEAHPDEFNRWISEEVNRL